MLLRLKTLANEDSHMLVKTAIKAALREWKLAEANKAAYAALGCRKAVTFKLRPDEYCKFRYCRSCGKG